jgi:hypothetical protein
MCTLCTRETPTLGDRLFDDRAVTKVKVQPVSRVRARIDVEGDPVGLGGGRDTLVAPILALRLRARRLR